MIQLLISASPIFRNTVKFLLTRDNICVLIYIVMKERQTWILADLGYRLTWRKTWFRGEKWRIRIVGTRGENTGQLDCQIPLLAVSKFARPRTFVGAGDYAMMYKRSMQLSLSRDSFRRLRPKKLWRGICNCLGLLGKMARGVRKIVINSLCIGHRRQDLAARMVANLPLRYSGRLNRCRGAYG